jgi:hypothetical protein
MRARRFTDPPDQALEDTLHGNCIRSRRPCRRARTVVACIVPCETRPTPKPRGSSSPSLWPSPLRLPSRSLRRSSRPAGRVWCCVGAGERGAGGGGAWGRCRGVGADGPAQSRGFGRRGCLGAASDGLDHQDHGCLVTLKGGNLDEETTLSPSAVAFATPAYSNVGLVAGDTLSVRSC